MNNFERQAEKYYQLIYIKFDWGKKEQQSENCIYSTAFEKMENVYEARYTEIVHFTDVTTQPFQIKFFLSHHTISASIWWNEFEFNVTIASSIFYFAKRWTQIFYVSKCHREINCCLKIRNLVWQQKKNDPNK